MSSTTSKATINVLRCVFSRFGYPETLVSDNGPLFSSSDFSKFCIDSGSGLYSGGLTLEHSTEV